MIARAVARVRNGWPTGWVVPCVWLALPWSLACGTDGYVFVSLDTDVAVPRLADRVRIDVYAVEPKLVWIASRDLAIGVHDEADAGVVAAPLPMSFTIDAEERGQVLLRVRLYREGDVRDLDPELRLRVHDDDLTPRSEPEPGLSIDRLALIEVPEDRVANLNLLLAGDCFGAEAELEAMQTCVNGRESGRLRSARVTLPLGATAPTVSRAGEWRGERRTGCEGTIATTDRVCLPSALFVFGDETIIDIGAAAATPRRLVRVSPFVIDRSEYSIGRYRAAIASGFVRRPGAPALEVGFFDGCQAARPLAGPVFPVDDRLPLACVDRATAQALCEREGGRLPTEVQWERAAVASESREGRRYPWPETDAFGCGSACYARSDNGSGFHTCATVGLGPGPADAAHCAADEHGPAIKDQTADQVVRLAGGVAEWTRDDFVAYADDRWRAQPLLDPACLGGDAELGVVRGGSWRGSADRLRSASRAGLAPDEQSDEVGFRCVYPVVR